MSKEEHLSIVKRASKKIAKLNHQELRRYRDFVSTLDINLDAKDSILGDIDSRLCRDDSISIAIAEESEILPGEVE